MLDVGQGRRQGCVLAPLLINMLGTAALRVDEKRFPADAAFMDNIISFQPKEEKGEKKGKATSGQTRRVGGREGGGGGKEEEEEAQGFGGMLYADDVGIVS